MRETRSILMMTRLFCIPVLDSNRNLRSPCSRIFSDIQNNCWSSHKLPKGLVRGSNFFPLRFKFIKLISGISLSILNRFSRFQRRCVLLEIIFPTTYNMTQYVQGIPRKNRLTEKRQVPFLVPQSRYRNGNNTVRIVRINLIFEDMYDDVWSTSKIP